MDGMKETKAEMAETFFLVGVGYAGILLVGTAMAVIGGVRKKWRD